MAYRTKICDEGGIFNVSRPSQYSAETRTFLNELIKESRLTTLQRKSLHSWLRSSSSQPQIAKTSSKSNESANTVKRYRSSRPRTLKNIVESGAYEPEVYTPNVKLRNYDVEKEKLQSIMAFGKVNKLDSVVISRKVNKEKIKMEYSEEELVNSVISEIEDREKFLWDMELLGQGPKYRSTIIHEICVRIKKLEDFVNKTSFKYRIADIQNIADKYRIPLESPKTLPISL